MAYECQGNLICACRARMCICGRPICGMHFLDMCLDVVYGCIDVDRFRI